MTYIVLVTLMTVSFQNTTLKKIEGKLLNLKFAYILNHSHLILGLVCYMISYSMNIERQNILSGA